jgi:hypothetical protein
MYKVSNKNAVPQISIDGEMIIGFNEPLLRQKLGLTAVITAPTSTFTPIPTMVTPIPTAAPTTQPYPTIMPAGNLAPNSSFEDGTTTPLGWEPQVRNTDASLQWASNNAYNRDHSLSITGSQAGSEGWPGWETQKAIPVDPSKKYEFSAFYYVPENGLLWMDIELINSSGTPVGWISTGTSSLVPEPNKWLYKKIVLDPMALKNSFPDIAQVKLGLRLSLNYDVANIPAATVSSIYYDYVYFGATEEPANAISTTTPVTTSATSIPYTTPPVITSAGTPGRIILVNQTNPSNYSFDFEMSYGAQVGYPNGLKMPNGFQVDSGFTLIPGTYSIVGYISYGWQVSIDINDPSGGSSFNGTHAFINLAAGETVVVTYMSTNPAIIHSVTPGPTFTGDPGQIILVNHTNPAGYSNVFQMSYGPQVGYPDGLYVRDDQQVDSGLILAPGIYTISEILSAGWQIVIAINDPTGDSSFSGSQSSINLAAGETVTVTYTNTRAG